MEMKQFFTAGINYKKTDAAIRGEFAIGSEQYASLLEKATHKGIKEVFVLSTCNRTEIYGIADNVQVLIDLLCQETAGDAATFQQLCYIKQGSDAIQHIFEVGAGLDSQILGDYEIVGQMKLAVKFARERGCICAFMERLFNTVLQSSKAIKNETALSGGTISVSFAAIQFLKQQLSDTRNKKIVLLGTGKIGRNTCKNLVDYLNTTDITLINRTDDKAIELAAELGLKATPFAAMQAEVNAADIVIVATNAEKPMITRQDLLHSGPKILIDLSIPNNIEPAAGTLPQITLANVDDLSVINDITLQKRIAEVPKARTIIQQHRQEFAEWWLLRSHVPVLKAVKQKLHDMHSCSMFQSISQVSSIDKAAIQKVVNTVAVKMRSQHQPGCYYIEAINDFMTSN
ncbi:MAG: glutamyl-tRNA reductase [Bacteroidetes bacterium]|nr:glutamyl-tRNA reductase [Bacteroidota bacterium]